MTTDDQELLARRFEACRSHLRAVAYRMLGSPSEADDAVQEAWLRLSRSEAGAIENLKAWLTTVVARVCLDMLRSRAARREEPMQEPLHESVEAAPAGRGHPIDPEQEAVLADSVSVAMLVMLDRLTPAERVAFVLRDAFAVPFEDIAGILGRSSTAVRQLASRARRHLQGASLARPTSATLAQERQVVEKFLAALRAGDVAGLIAVLDPEVVVRREAGAGGGKAVEIRGAENWARGAVAFAQQAQGVSLAVLNGSAGLVWASQGRLLRALRFTFAGGKIVQAEIIADPVRLRELEVSN